MSDSGSIETLNNFIIEQGAAAAGMVSISDCLPYENEKMRVRRLGLDFAPAGALIAAFPFYTRDTAPPKDWSRPSKVLPLYARGKDYLVCNKVRLERAAQQLRELFPGYHFRPSGNGWPLPVVQAARLAGLGCIGLHGLLIVPEYGSTVTLGAILTDLPLPPSQPGGYCEQCGACLKACQTGALSWDGKTRRFDKTLCRSFLSQQKELSPGQEALLRGSPYALGCDDCQNACPHNQNPRETGLPEFREDLIHSLSPEEALALSPEHKLYKNREQCARNIGL